MKVTFTRTGDRRYSVSVEGPDIDPLIMDPAPGFDPKMPHDMAHFIVENELGIMGGLFGQLAAGGHAGTFRPVDGGKKAGRKERKGDRLIAASKVDAELSERLVYWAWQIWTGHPDKAAPVKGYTEKDMRHVCNRFEEISAQWESLRVGGSLTLEWRGKATHRYP
jgi:hypothetical protein